LKAALRILNRWVAHRCAEIVVTDENRIVGGLEAFRHKISIVGNCPPDLNSGRPRAAKPGELVVAAFGNLSSTRGIGLLVAASARVRDVRVLTAGRFVEPWLETKVRSAHSVEHLGVLSQEQALRQTSEADIVFAFYDPSISINRLASSAKWYDAMMAGRPVVSNREIVNAPWIEREGFGFTCAYDEDSLASTLKWIRDHPEERAEKGARARRLFESTFNREAMNAKICQAARRAAGLIPPLEKGFDQTAALI
jgi:glycosyltransferase involved in cell wall biosynthesis